MIWSIYHWIRERIFKRKPIYAGIPMRIEVFENDKWVDLEDATGLPPGITVEPYNYPEIGDATVIWVKASE